MGQRNWTLYLICLSDSDRILQYIDVLEDASVIMATVVLYRVHQIWSNWRE